MISELKSIDEYLKFAEEIYADEDYRDPHLSSCGQIRSELNDALADDSKVVLGVFENDRITGIFVILVYPEEQYGEYLLGLSKSRNAYGELFAYLRENCAGYQLDFVYGPKNELIAAELKKRNAVFFTEQTKMVLKEYRRQDRKHTVVAYDDKYREQYLAIHQDEDSYWTGEKVLEASDLFRVILGLEGGAVVGYVDITYCYEENEPYDVFVLPGYRNRGMATEMLSLAIEMNKDKGLMLLVDIDNPSAVRVYEKLGFVKTFGGNITARINPVNN